MDLKRALGWFKRKPIEPTPLALDREGTPGIVRPPVLRCPRCKRSVNAWRRYADGRVECVGCATKAGK